jgi:AraC-like DNA-binding protein
MRSSKKPCPFQILKTYPFQTGRRKEKQLYKVHGLQVADLAKELGTNTTYISACINKETGASFNDLVNGCRIRHALDLLDGNPGMPVTQVADLSGFSSYSSFLRSFRQFTGKTPTEYLSADDPAAGTQP